MADPFVWFDLRSTDPAASRSFYKELLGWVVTEVPVGDQPVPIVGGERPWASIVTIQGDRPG